MGRFPEDLQVKNLAQILRYRQLNSEAQLLVQLFFTYLKILGISEAFLCFF
jgi:hypothetical protein